MDHWLQGKVLCWASASRHAPSWPAVSALGCEEMQGDRDRAGERLGVWGVSTPCHSQGSHTPRLRPHSHPQDAPSQSGSALVLSVFPSSGGGVCLTSCDSVLADPGPDSTLRTTAPDHLSPRNGRQSKPLSGDSGPPGGLQPDTRMARDLGREKGEVEACGSCDSVQHS